jgi:hypothetical protein
MEGCGLHSCVQDTVQWQAVMNMVKVTLRVKVGGKAIPITGRGGPQGCKKLRLPHFLDNRLTDGCDAAAALYPPGRFLVLISVRG